MHLWFQNQKIGDPSNTGGFFGVRGQHLGGRELHREAQRLWLLKAKQRPDPRAELGGMRGACEGRACFWTPNIYVYIYIYTHTFLEFV